MEEDGTKGAYEVGVFKALKELNINITAIVGASIGAINGALYLQDDFDKIMELYDVIELNNIIDVKDKINTKKNIFNIANIAKIAKEYTFQRGFDNEPLRKMMHKYINVDKIYNSNIDFGIITYAYKDNEPLEIFKEYIPKDKMYDYLLASSCFPIYKSQKIGNNSYYDGGLYDNIPTNMLVRKGYKNIIVIDVSGIGVKRKLIDSNVYIKMIHSNEDLGGTFNFNKDRMKRNIGLGYLDTLRAFNKVQGHIYYFLTAEFNKMLEVFSLQTIYGLEYAAQIYNMDKIKKYSMEEFLEELTLKHKEALIKYTQFSKEWDLKKIVAERFEMRKIINKGLGLCFIQELFKNNPTYRNSKLINKLFSDYVVSSDAMIELENYK